MEKELITRVNLLPLSKGKVKMGATDIVTSDGKTRGIIISDALADEIIKRVNNWDEAMLMLSTLTMIDTESADGVDYCIKVQEFLSKLNE